MDEERNQPDQPDANQDNSDQANPDPFDSLLILHPELLREGLETERLTRKIIQPPEEKKP